LQSVAVCCLKLEPSIINAESSPTQHTTLHCNALQRTATPCNTLQHPVAHQKQMHLLIAAQHAEKEELQQLLGAGTKVNCRDDSGGVPERYMNKDL